MKPIKLYLEISGRQSGKTARLIKAAQNHPGNSVIVVKSESQADAMVPTNPTTEIIPAAYFSRYVRARGGHKADRRDNTRYFFLDFDQFLTDVPLLATGYYATSPKRIREADENPNKDLLLQLVAHCTRNKIPIHNFRNSEYGAQFKTENKGCTNRDTIYQLHVLGRYHRKQLV